MALVPPELPISGHGASTPGPESAYLILIDDLAVLELKAGGGQRARPARSARPWPALSAHTDPVRCPTSIQGDVNPRQPMGRGCEERPAGGVPHAEGGQVESWAHLVAVDLDIHEPVPGTQLACDDSGRERLESESGSAGQAMPPH